jgi:hypothetical protein
LAQREQYCQVRVDRVGLTTAASILAGRPLSLDQRQPGRGKRARQPDPVFAGPVHRGDHPRAGACSPSHATNRANPPLLLTISIVAISDPVGLAISATCTSRCVSTPDHRIDHIGQHRHRASPFGDRNNRSAGTGLEELTEWHLCDGSRRYGGQASNQANQVGQVGAGDQADESAPWHAKTAGSAASHTRSPTPNLHSISNQKCRTNTHRSAAAAARPVADARPQPVKLCGAA